MKLIGSLTTRQQSFDGRRTLSNRGLILFAVLIALTFGIAPISHQVAVIFGTMLFILLIGGGILGAGLTARDFRHQRSNSSRKTNERD